MSHARIHQLMTMTLISPAIQEEILLGDNQCLTEIPEYKLREIVNEPNWQIQQTLWKTIYQNN
jgi:hypothetical protein